MKEPKKHTKRMSSSKKVEREFIKTEIITKDYGEDAVMVEIPLSQFEDENGNSIDLFSAIQIGVMMAMQAIGIEGNLTIRDNDGVLEIIVEK